MAQIQLAGEAFTPSSLKAVFQADTDAMTRSDNARAAANAAVKAEDAVHVRTQSVLSALRSFLIGYFGKNAVTILADFEMKSPGASGPKTVTTKAVAVAKAKATRAARGTKGPVARQAIVGTVNESAIKQAINDPNAAPASGASAPATGTGAAPATGTGAANGAGTAGNATTPQGAAATKAGNGS